jgi:predicted TIM-barrel enzyme
MRERVREAGAEVVLVNVGVLGERQVTADVSRRKSMEALVDGGFLAGGASSLERLPTEVAMTENMRRFKSIPIKERA